MRLPLTFLCAALCSAASYADVDCPKSINVQPQQIAAPNPGWRVFTDKVNTQYNLESVTFYNGKPEELASLVPDNDGGDYIQWTLTDNGKQTYFLACRYTNTSLQLTQQIPQSAKTCRVSYDRKVTMGGLPVPLKVSCQ